MDPSPADRTFRELLRELDLSMLASGDITQTLSSREQDSNQLEDKFTSLFFDDIWIDSFPGVIVMHFRNSSPTALRSLEKLASKRCEGTGLNVEALWFEDTGSCQIAIVDESVAT